MIDGKTWICVLKRKYVLVKHKFGFYNLIHLCFQKTNLLYIKHKFANSKHGFTPKLVKFQNTNLKNRQNTDLLFKKRICL